MVRRSRLTGSSLPPGTFALSGHVLTGAAPLGGRQVGIRIESSVLLLFDLDTRELLRTRPNPLTEKQVLRLRGLSPAEPACTAQPRASHRPTPRRPDRAHLCRQTADRSRPGVRPPNRDAHVSETTITVELGDGDTYVVRRTTTMAVVNM
jgi:hypothetical protein